MRRSLMTNGERNQRANELRPPGNGFDGRDREIERLRNECDELRAREQAVRAELEETRKRFAFFTGASKRFAASMRGRTTEGRRQRIRLSVQYAVSRVLARASTLGEAAPEILSVIGERLGWEAGVLWTVDGDTLRCESTWRPPESAPNGFEEACRRTRFPRGVGLPGRVWSRGEPVCVQDLLANGETHEEALAGEKFRGALAFPIRDGRLFGVLELLRSEPLTPDEDMLQTAALIGQQIAQFIERRQAEEERDRSLVRERRTRRDLAGILESIDDAFFAVDSEWRFTYVNRRAEEFWSRSREELLGKNSLKELPHLVDSEQYQAIRRAKEEGVTATFESVFPDMGILVAGRAYPTEDGVSVYFQDITERRRAEEEHNRLQARELVARAEVDERKRISRDLHDRVAHAIGVAYQSLQLYEVFQNSDPSQAAAKLGLAKKMTKTALESTRNLSMELRRSEGEVDLEEALQDLLEIAVPQGTHAELRTRGDGSLLSPRVRWQLFLILREAVRNAVAHSGADHINVELEITPKLVEGRVADNGRGLPESDNGARFRVGLKSMKERATLLGGDLRILSPLPAGGTSVEVSVPLEGDSGAG